MKPFDPETAKHGDELFYCGNKAYYIGRSVKDESRSVIEWEKNMSDVYPLGLVENALIQVPAKKRKVGMVLYSSPSGLFAVERSVWEAILKVNGGIKFIRAYTEEVEE